MDYTSSSGLRGVSKNYHWYVVFMLWWIAFFNYADRQALSAVFPLLKTEYNLTDGQLGLLGAAFAWVYGLCAPVAGYLGDRIRRKTAILFGLEIWSLICMATAWARTFPQLVFLRSAIGLGETVYFPSAMSFLSDYHGKRTRSRAMGIHQTSVYIGTIAGSYFAALIGAQYGWRWSFIVFGGLGVVLGFILLKFLVEPERGIMDRQEAGATTKETDSTGTEAVSAVAGPKKLSIMDFLRVIWGTPTVLILMAAFMCANFVALVLLTWMPTYLNRQFGMSLAMSGLNATIYVQLASMCAAPLGGWLADRMRMWTPGGRMLVQALGVLGGAPFVALCGLTHSIFWLLVALTCWGFFKGLYDANIFASVYDVIRPEARGTAAGFMNTVGWLAGGGTAPIVIGYIAESHGLSFAIATASIVYVLAGALLLIGVFCFAKRDSDRMQASVAA